MRNIKKVLFLLVLVAGIFTLAGCSNSAINGLAENFEEENYNMYEYKNYIAANFNLDTYLSDEEATDEDSEDGATTVDRVSTNQMFIPVDHMSLELRAYILDGYDIQDASALEEITIDDYPELSVIDDLNYDVYVFANYVQVELTNESLLTISRTVVVIEFPSEDYLREVLEVSTVLEALFASYEDKLGIEIDVEDHVNGRMLMLAPNNVDRLDYYNQYVEIFNRSESE
jgi:hypothetical protein